MNRIEYMFSIFEFVSVLFLMFTANARARGRGGIDFDKNYVVTWGQNHVLKLNQGKEVELSMDQSSGSGFESKSHYGSGFFQMRIKLPPRDSAGVVTAFYLTSKGDTHDEVDFEFLGNRQGKPIGIQTNVFTNGQGNREQKFVLWFDPTTSFHTYGILWNPYHIVFYVDKIPIRVFKNNRFGVNYPSKPMQLVASLWNGEEWATNGGKDKINWAYAPFKAQFQGFPEHGCRLDGQSNNRKVCGSTRYWWNNRTYNRLSANEQKTMENVRAKYMTYDYCSDRPRYPVPPTECRLNK
ncbi:PREDICTED: xyloglucan endotransglucosylase/hydrolase protein 2 [Camelina sativa]|uniref:Xyloglucan endotransglucosylase/hydrolase n=1 Tax=Camelina sativa TaxID=90675 RepID=A0ABM0UG43_CAMSA|nr:PREDICTED: xyloglucan endotransglucosylase/hydrolase protein 2 [Camelina sativa]